MYKTISIIFNFDLTSIEYFPIVSNYIVKLFSFNNKALIQKIIAN